MAKKTQKRATRSEKKCWDCASDPIGKLKQMFVDIVQTRRIEQGQNPARRPVFLKPHGVAHGRFEMRRDLPGNLKVGVFALKSLPAWVRFSSDTTSTSPDLKTTCGIGIKLFGVPGAKLLGDGETQDFILQNMDVFFVDDAKAMCEFTKAGVVEGDYDRYIDSHPVTKRILKEMEKVELSTLTATYWSVLPYAFGKGRYVKYKLEPETKPDGLPSNDPNYLAADLARRLRAGEARFRFMVQFFVNEKVTPLDKASVRWSETESKPIQLATLILPRQDITALGQASYGENLAYNPWHALAEHKPEGSISEARRVVYAASASERHDANGVPYREPDAVRPDAALHPVDDGCIVRAAIYPSIGIARVGNAKEEYFLAPEVTDPLPEKPGFYRDPTGALKRQAVRFRVYGLNAEGRVVAELTAADAEIKWTVHLANQKAAWYEFQLAQDIPEAASAPAQMLRNITVSDRATLTIDPGERHVSGRKARAQRFDTGKFVGKPVYLGEIRTDEQGRLIVLGGHGKSASYNGTHAVTFANNDAWHDDVSDGPVRAEVRYRGETLKTAPAWVVVAPPNYGPLQKSVRTMWDLMRDVAIKAGTLTAPMRPSFDRDIRPIFERLTHLEWVNAGFAAAYGWKGPNNLSTVAWLTRLSRNTPDDQEMRLTIANTFRVFARDAWSPTPWPWLYGDAMNIPTPHTPLAFAALTDTQLNMLQQWAAGDFVSDYDPKSTPPRRLEDVPIAAQGDMLDRASLEFCLADAFHPGCEMTWPMRLPTMYMAPFRLAHADPQWVVPNYGAAFTSDLLTLPNGPFYGQVPGGLTRWMAVPWQADTASCRSGYTPKYDPYLPTFWPARVPNQVLSEANYRIVMDPKRPLGERLAAFANRAAWIRPLMKPNPSGRPVSYTEQINRMIADISQMGVVETREGLKRDPNFPAVMQVENLPAHTAKAFAAADHGELRHDPTDLTEIAKARRFPQGLKTFQ
jgi:L-lysine epsilon oxidase-like protein